MRLVNPSGYDLIELAVWPQPFYGKTSWIMHSLKLREDKSVCWYRRSVEREGKNGSVFAEVYEGYSEAVEVARVINKELINNIDLISMPDVDKMSLRLKVDKALTAKSRLMNEEQLMLEVAIRNNANNKDLISKRVDIEPEYEKLREALSVFLLEMPYLRFIYIQKYGISFICNESDCWIRCNLSQTKAGKVFYQERIARGFGLSGFSHWGKTKAKIRLKLLPRANQLLQLASVKRMLAEAEIKGQKVLLVDGFVFWYEENNQIGWIVKEASDSKAFSKGNTLWREGCIISKNHGRIVVLPYIKENGEFVKGHTKNAPDDGKALPRHKDEYVELPFEVLEEDVMRGLFGELFYE